MSENIALRDQVAVEALSLIMTSLRTAESIKAPINQEAVYAGVKFTLLYLWEAALMNKPEIFIDNVSWFLSTADSHQFPPFLIRRVFNALKEVLAGHWRDERYAAMSDILDKAEELSVGEDQGSYLEQTGVMKPYCQKYLQLLLGFKKEEARQHILGLVRQQLVDIPTVFHSVLQPVQYEVGRLWQIGAITVAQEHFCTAVTTGVIDTLIESSGMVGTHGKSFLGMCVQGEFHTLGIRLVCSNFALSGWTVLNFEGNTPLEGVIKLAETEKIDVIGISVTMPYHFNIAAGYIRRLKQLPDAIRPKILVGGRAFNNYEDMWEKLGADGYAPEAGDTVRLADALV